MLIPYDKPPLTYNQQIDLLISRGLRVQDRAEAQGRLADVSYYRLSAYALPFKDGFDCFHPGTTWEQVVELYEFDRRLRIQIMDAIERVEVALRAAIIYELSHAYGAFAHVAPAHLRPDFGHVAWTAKLEEESRKSCETFIEHFRTKYEGFPRFPIWMATEVMSFGSLSRLFEGMLSPDQQKVSSRHGLPHFVMRSWLRSLTFIRNVCAHHGRLWNRELAVAPRLPERKHGWVPGEIPDQKRLFCVLVMLRHLLGDHERGTCWQSDVSALIEPIAQTPRFRLAMGLPGNWRSHPRWDHCSVLPERVWVPTTGSGWIRMGIRHQAAIRRESSRADEETTAWKTGSCTRSCWASSSHG